jgi:hypothetical protein
MTFTLMHFPETHIRTPDRFDLSGSNRTNVPTDRPPPPHSRLLKQSFSDKNAKSHDLNPISFSPDCLLKL